MIEFVLRGDRYISGAVDPIPLRERCALNVVSHGLCRLVDRVRAKIGDDSLHNSLVLVRSTLLAVIGGEFRKARAHLLQG